MEEYKFVSKCTECKEAFRGLFAVEATSQREQLKKILADGKMRVIVNFSVALLDFGFGVQFYNFEFEYHNWMATFLFVVSMCCFWEFYKSYVDHKEQEKVVAELEKEIEDLEAKFV